MSLVPHKIVALESATATAISTGKTTIAGAVVIMYDSDNNAITLYDDAAFTNGAASKVTGSTGELIVWITAGQYTQSVNGSTALPVTVGSASPITVDAFANMLLLRPEQTDQAFTCQERANAKYILQVSGYVALAGDATFANGRVAALQIKNKMDVRNFGAKADGVTNDTSKVVDCALRSDYVTCDKSLTVLISKVTILSGQKFKDISFKLADGTDEEALSCERNSVGCEFIRVKVNGNRANNTGLCHTIRFNGSTDAKVIDCNLFDVEGNGISAFIGDTSNVNMEITGNRIRFTDGDSIEVRGSSGLRITNNTMQSWDAGHNAIEFQEPHIDLIVSNNIFIDERGDLFGIESAGATASVENFIISNNTFKGNYIGISGLFKKGVISSNCFNGGVGTWRSGIELASSDVVVDGNFIDNGSIAIASHGSTTPVYNAKNIKITNNFIRNKGVDSKALYLGAAASANGTPTATDIVIDNNIFDFTEATGTGGRALIIGQYTSGALLNRVKVTNNTIIGNGTTASTRGVLIHPGANSVKVSVKNNSISGFANNVNLVTDDLTKLILTNNDLEDFINNAFLDGSTTTTVINTGNIV